MKRAAIYVIAFGALIGTMTLSGCPGGTDESSSTTSGAGGESGGGGGAGEGGGDAGSEPDGDTGHHCMPEKCFQPPTACGYAMCINDLQCGIGFTPPETPCKTYDTHTQGECNGSGLCNACPLDCNKPTGGCQHGTTACP